MATRTLAKPRRCASAIQVSELESTFEVDPRPSHDKRLFLSKKLNMSPRTVQIWFQNRRAKARSQNHLMVKSVNCKRTKPESEVLEPINFNLNPAANPNLNTNPSLEMNAGVNDGFNFLRSQRYQTYPPLYPTTLNTPSNMHEFNFMFPSQLNLAMHCSPQDNYHQFQSYDSNYGYNHLNYNYGYNHYYDYDFYGNMNGFNHNRENKNGKQPRRRRCNTINDFQFVHANNTNLENEVNNQINSADENGVKNNSISHNVSSASADTSPPHSNDQIGQRLLDITDPSYQMHLNTIQEYFSSLQNTDIHLNEQENVILPPFLDLNLNLPNFLHMPTSSSVNQFSQATVPHIENFESINSLSNLNHIESNPNLSFHMDNLLNHFINPSAAATTTNSNCLPSIVDLNLKLNDLSFKVGKNNSRNTGPENNGVWHI